MTPPSSAATHTTDRRRFLLGGSATLAACALPGMVNAQAGGPTPLQLGSPRPCPSPSQLAWQREELAMFVHIGLNTFTNREWGDGSEDPALFNPRRLDARQWARAARQAGFGTLILTAKHHDGFCLWPTATTSHSIAASPWRDGKGDLVREFVDACRAEGLGTGIYLSPWDRNHPAYGQGDAYNDVYVAQLTELLSGYGPMREVWFDGANGEGSNGRRQNYDWQRIHATVRRLQPEAVMFSDAGPDLRWVGNEDGSAGSTCWSQVDPARVPAPGATDSWTLDALQQGDPDGSVWRPAETDVSIRPGWFWHAQETAEVRSPDNLLGLYFSSVGRNSKLLLNVPPNRDGLFDAADLAALEGWHARREALFSRNLLQTAQVRASDGEDAAAVLQPATAQRHWQAPTTARSGWLEFELAEPLCFDVVRLQEAIEHGQHIAGWRLQTEHAGQWRTTAWGTTVGHCHLLRIAPVTTRHLRLLIDFAYAQPRIASIGLFRDPAQASTIQRPDDHSQ